MAVSAPSPVDVAVARLDRWLESMRGPDGYGGPVVHWWRSCLVFCGAGLDWRYEGIIAGYLALFARSGQPRWLEKARRAGNDLVRGQQPDGHYQNSRFELNPGAGGTPHEAAADVGLLLLARVLRECGDAGWTTYLRAAETNLERCFVERLWCQAEQRFWDDPGQSSFVPNKAATLIEALCLLADLTGRDEWLSRYVRPTAEAILSHQVRAPGEPLDGAIAQNSIGRSTIAKYFPYYNARCVPGLVVAHRRLGDERYVEAALRATAFVLRWRDADGAFPQVVYGSGQVNRYPRWIAGVGDVLRAAELLRPFGLDFPAELTLRWLLAGQLASGGVASAEGFGVQVSQRRPGDGARRDFRDYLPVCGWTDKAFRYLAGKIVAVPDDVAINDVTAVCSLRGRAVELREDDQALTLVHQGHVIGRWPKGSAWAELRAPWALVA